MPIFGKKQKREKIKTFNFFKSIEGVQWDLNPQSLEPQSNTLTT